MFCNAGVARFVYNWNVNYQQMNYDIGNNFISDNDLRKVLTTLKSTEKMQWLNKYSNNVAKQAVKDACDLYGKFFKGLSKYPKFKSKKKSKSSFYVDTDKIQFTSIYVKLVKIANSTKKNKAKANWIHLSEHDRMPTSCKCSNPRVTFDGLNWWISVGVECSKITEQPTNEDVGIDIGIKDLAVCYEQKTYKNINKTSKMRKLAKKKRRLQCSVSRKYPKNKKDENYCKTSSIIKSQNQLLKINRRLTNIRHNHLHQVTSEIVKRKPSFIVLEDLNVNCMSALNVVTKSTEIFKQVSI